MKKNKNLKSFYQKVYKKGEKKHYTTFVLNKKPSEESLEVLKQTTWKGKNVLDVGCGTGLFSFLCAKKGAKVLGIDYANEAIEIANKTHKLPNLTYDVLDVKNVKGKFDVIVSIGAIEHMDKPYEILKLLKKKIKKNGKIIITTPNWTNPRGYMLMTLQLLFNSPITLADLHYLTPLNHQEWAKKLKMNLKWKTIDKEWGHGEVWIKDYKKRIPNVIRDSKLPYSKKKIDNLINWCEKYVKPLDNSLPHSGAIGVYVYYIKS